jgi:hypothetical protein
MSQLARRAVATGSLAAIALVIAAPSAQAAGGGPGRPAFFQTTPADAGASWLAGQLTGSAKDHYLFPGSTFADDGNTADGVLAMDAAEVAHNAAARATAWLEGDAANYAGTAPNFYPGSLAKLLLVAEAEHIDVHSFGGLDLVGSLTGLEASDGLYADPDTQYGYESTISQALALIALSNTGTASEAPDANAITWLTDQQCPDGGFRNNETPHTVQTCTSDLDTTSFASQGLVETGTSATSAVNWLSNQQNSDGGFGSPSNANSTAVAAQALLAAGQEPTLALLWLRKHQQGCTADGAQWGAIRFDDGAFDAGTALRASTQATQAIALAPLADIDASDSAGRTPVLSCAVAEQAGGGGGVVQPTANHPHDKATDSGVEAATLPRTGPAPVGPTLGIATDLLFVGTLLVFFARRRSA